VKLIGYGAHPASYPTALGSIQPHIQGYGAHPASYPTALGPTQPPIQRLWGPSSILFKAMGPTQPPIQWLWGPPSLLSNGYEAHTASYPTATGPTQSPIQRLCGSPSLLYNGYVARPASYPTAMGLTQPPMDPAVLSWGVKWSGRKADHSFPSSAKVNVWSYTSTPPQAWCLVKHKRILYLYQTNLISGMIILRLFIRNLS
jgi:hypothetical protein